MIDRQLGGRCGRQGDPGTVARFISLSDPLLMAHAPAIWRYLAARLPRSTRGMATRWVAWLARRRAERLHSGMRRDLLRGEEWLGDVLAFAGEDH